MVGYKSINFYRTKQSILRRDLSYALNEKIGSWIAVKSFLLNFKVFEKRLRVQCIKYPSTYNETMKLLSFLFLSVKCKFWIENWSDSVQEKRNFLFSVVNYKKNKREKFAVEKVKKEAFRMAPEHVLRVMDSAKYLRMISSFLPRLAGPRNLI